MHNKSPLFSVFFADVNLRFEACDFGFTSTVCRLKGLELKGPGLTALVGSNGSGKSTMLRTLAGLHELIGGSIFLNEQPVEELSIPEKAQLISIVLTERVSLGGLRVRDIVAMGRHPFVRQDSDIDRIQHAMDSMGISGLAELPMDAISDGERQKVVIARAICQDTPLVILDEPTAFLDFRARMDLFEVLRDLARTKRVIFSSHDLRALLEVPCDLLVCGTEVKYFSMSDSRLHLQEMIARFSPASEER